MTYEVSVDRGRDLSCRGTLMRRRAGRMRGVPGSPSARAGAVSIEITDEGVLIRRRTTGPKQPLPWSEADLIEGLTPHTAHTDELPQRTDRTIDLLPHHHQHSWRAERGCGKQPKGTLRRRPIDARRLRLQNPALRAIPTPISAAATLRWPVRVECVQVRQQFAASASTPHDWRAAPADPG